MTRRFPHFAVLMIGAVTLASVVPRASASAQNKAPLIDKGIRDWAAYLEYYAFDVPYVRTSIGASWDRTVYEPDPTNFVSGISCASFAVVWSGCINNPNAPEVDQREHGSRGGESNTAGELLVRQIQTTPMSNVSRFTEGSAYAKGVTDIGSNQLYVAARGGFEREVFFPSYISYQSGGSGGSTKNEHLWMSAGGLSIWSDTFTPDFTGPMTIGLSAYLHGSAVEEASFVGALPAGGTRSVESALRFGIFDPTQEMYYGNSFEHEYLYSPSSVGPGWVDGLFAETSARFGLSPYSLTFDVVSGRTYSMVMALDAYARQNAVIDLFGTSKVDFFQVPDGGTVSFGGGNFTVRTAGLNGPEDGGPGDGGPGDGSPGDGGPIDGGPIASVPEPSAVWLMLPALLVLLARRRKARA